MAIQAIKLKPGINREGTRYTTEGGYYDGDKIRFRQGTPEKIGGWTRISASTFQGVCRSLHNWVTLGGQNLIGVGTHLKFFIENVSMPEELKKEIFEYSRLEKLDLDKLTKFKAAKALEAAAKNEGAAGGAMGMGMGFLLNISCKYIMIFIDK